MVVSDIGALELVGVAGSAYLAGLAVANFEWIGCIPAMILAAFLFIPFYWKARIYTIPEYLGRRYNDVVRTRSGRHCLRRFPGGIDVERGFLSEFGLHPVDHGSLPPLHQSRSVS